MAQSLAYVVGLAGVLAGALLYRDDEIAFAMIIWVVTFAAGAVLMITAFITRAIASVLARLAHLESDVTVLVGRRGAGSPGAADDGWGTTPRH